MISKKDFMQKYGYSKSTWQRRMAELKTTPIFNKAYIAVTSQDIWIDEELYQKFMAYKSANRLRKRKIKPAEFLKNEGNYGYATT